MNHCYRDASSTVLLLGCALLVTLFAKDLTAAETLSPGIECPSQYLPRLDTEFIAGPGVAAQMAAIQPSRLLVCQSTSTDPSDGLARLLIQLWSDKSALLAQSTVPLDIEGQLRDIQQAEAEYKLHPKGFSLAFTLDVRVHEVDFDKHNKELWLFWFDGKNIRHLLSTSTEMQQWSTQCAESCDDSIHTFSTLAVQSAGPDNFATLTIHTRREIFPEGDTTKQPVVFQESQSYVFNGKKYELLAAEP